MSELSNISTLIEETAKRLNIQNPEMIGKIGNATALSGIAPVGNWAANKGVDKYFKSHGKPEEEMTKEEKRHLKKTKHLMVAAASLVCAAPMLGKVLGPDMVEQFKEGEWADFSMTSLTTAIAGTGIALNDRSFIQSAGVLAVLFAIAGEIEESVEANAEKGVKEMKALVPETARVRVFDKALPDGADHYQIDDTFKVEDIQAGQHIEVPPGGKIPANSTILEIKGSTHGRSSVIQNSAINGETGSRTVEVGEKIAQGEIANEHILIEARTAASESTILQNAKFLEEVKLGKTATSIENIVERGYVPLMVATVLGQLGYTYWKDRNKHEAKTEAKRETIKEFADFKDVPAQDIEKAEAETDHYSKRHDRGHSAQHAVERAAQLAIKMAPCAMMASLLVVPFTKYKLASNHNIHVRDSAVMEELKGIKTVITDLRGTLTKGEPMLTDHHIFNEMGEHVSEGLDSLKQNTLGLIGRAEQGSDHAMAKTISKAAKANGAELTMHEADEIIQANTFDNKGVIRKLDTHLGEQASTVTVGNADFVRENIGNIEIPQSVHDYAAKYEDSVIAHIERDGKSQWSVLGMEQDPFREGTKEALQTMLKDGKTVVVATGSQGEYVSKRISELKEGLPLEAQERLIVHENLSSEIHDSSQSNAQRSKAEVIDQYSTNGHKTTLFIGDAGNDAPAMAYIREKGGHAMAISSTAVESSKHFASMVIDGVHQLPELMTLSQNMSIAMKAQFAASTAWVGALVGHHFMGKEEKQPSTIKASFLHETPTILLAGLSAYLAGSLSEKVPTSMAERVTQRAASSAQGIHL